MRKLYNLKPNTVIEVDVNGVAYGQFLFSHLDGMYSLCYDENKNIHHLAAWTEVEVVTDVTVLDKFKGFL